MYMNKTKRNLIIAAAIINLIDELFNLIVSIILLTNRDLVVQYVDYMYFVSYSTNIVYSSISMVLGIVGSILLLYSIRQKGKYYRTSQGVYFAGFIITAFCGGFLPWILLLIAMFVPDIVIINRPEEVRKEEIKEEKEYEEKKKKIEDLKRMRDNGIISEEEYKEKLFELL